ncbi:MAG: hypothetical protein ISR58_00270 [Anaerolineales bacterium]|nr:hypothetical protein [Chloroflexota bacterium]MBL6979597.1 hypothetical protein [Anaerolineales bacterium]
MFTLDNLFLLLTGLLAIYLIWRFYTRYSKGKALHDVYYLLGFIVLLVSGLLLIFLGYGILGLGGTALSPFILPVASLIPLGISLGIANQFFPSWKKAFAWFALVGFLAIAVTSIGGMAGIKKFAVPIFHGVAGLVIFLGPFLAKGAPKGFFWVGIGGALIGIGGLALASLTITGAALFGIFTKELVFTILAPLLFLMALAFTFGFMKDLKA